MQWNQKFNAGSEIQMLGQVAREPHDLLMDWIVTEERLIDCRRRQ